MALYNCFFFPFAMHYHAHIYMVLIKFFSYGESEIGL